MSVRSVGARYIMNTGKNKHFILVSKHWGLLVVKRHYDWCRSIRWLNSKPDFSSKAKYSSRRF